MAIQGGDGWIPAIQGGDGRQYRVVMDGNTG
jgi:hypothetical protein